MSVLSVLGVSYGQATNTENYVQTRVYLEPVTTPSSTAKQIETVQYIDGLGRPKQVVNVKASPLGRDVVTHIEYDGFGRQVKDYLPVPQTFTANGSIFTAPLDYASNPAIYGSEKIYSENIFENSPLDRIKQQVHVGNDWSNKPIKLDYDANVAGEVIKYTTMTIWENDATKSTLSNGGSYGTAQLYKNTVTDEDGNKTINFKNGDGQTLLVRKVISDTDKADTYYVYNEYNQLAYVIPPNAAIIYQNLVAGTAIAYDDINLNDLCYRYRYDGRNRLVEKKLPGKGWEHMVYDKADRLIMTQDNNLRQDKRWLFTKYDKFSRAIYTGITADPNDRAIIQGYVDFTFPNNYEGSGSFTQNGLTVEYTNSNAFPTYIYQLLSVNYYDTYPQGTPSFTPTLPGYTVLTQDAQNSNISTKSLPVASYVKNIEDDNWTKNYTWYDTKGRAVATYSINHLGGYTKTESELDFAGVTKQFITKHKRLDADAEKVITENFTYDHQNRLLTHKHIVDNNPEEILAQNEYNELSQLKTKKVGGTNSATPLQTVDYAYNIRGWLTHINDPSNLGGDLFGYKINYNQREGLESPDAFETNLKVLPKYNGNIAEVVWKTATNYNDYLRRYGYVYDGLNRLLAGFYQNDANPSAGEYYEKMTYDLNGNIKTLRRTAALSTTGVANKIDDLTYVYENSNQSNRLSTVTDTAQNYGGYPDVSGNTIAYDLNGNMEDEKDKGILKINYNILNLPNYFKFNTEYIIRDFVTGEDEIRNVRLDYLYNANGTKLRKKYTYYFSKGKSERFSGTDYLNGFQYSINYLNSVSLDFVPTSEGYYDFKNNRYIYNYTDHLGNVRLSYQKDYLGNAYPNDENNYYPFGLRHEGYNNPGGNGSYNYKYNNKELQLETGMYDYGARFYMPDIGRWGVVDMLSEKYFSASNYTYVLNRPTVAVDPDGKRVYFIGGAGNDPESQGWNYVNRWGNYFDQAGMNFYRVNATRGTNEDLKFTAGFRNTGYEQIMRSPNSGDIIGGLAPSMVATNEQRPVQDDMIDATVNMYQNHLKDSPLQEGEQFNMAGYSYGSVLQAQAALRLADSGQIIDNVVLIGSPISDKSDLMKQLKGNKNIRNVIRYDFSGDLLSNPKDILDFLKGTYDSSPLGRGNGAPHLDGARPGKQANQLIQTIIQWLQEQGVKN